MDPRLKAQWLFWLVAGGALVLLAIGLLLVGHDRTVTITVPPVTAPANGTVVGKTPVIGLILVCTDGRRDWQVTNLVHADVVSDWPPKDTCQ